MAMNIAVFLPNWIGDVVMATPALRSLRTHFGQARFFAVCRPYVSGALEGSDWLEDTFFLDRRGAWSSRWPAVARRLRSEQMDLAILFPNSFRSAWVAWLSGAKRRIGFDRYLRGPLLTDRLQPQRDVHGRRQPVPIIDDYNRLAQAAGCPWPGYRMELFTTPSNERAADLIWDKFAWNADDEVICLNPGGAFGTAKHWHAEYFALLAQDLIDQRGSRVLVLCGPGERDTARRIAHLAARPDVRSLADEPLSVGLTKAVVRRSNLLVTTDSGPRHFAAAFGRPVITLFGPTHIAWTETYYGKAIHLQKQVPCGPCQKRVCPLDHRCMTQLSPADVFAAVNELMARMERSRALPASSPGMERKAS
jgi:heptosyltransferase-2